MATYIICYDISNTKRLAKAARILQGYALRLQRSVYLLEASPTTMQRCWQTLCGCINAKEDDLRCYRVSGRYALEFFGVSTLHDAVVLSGLDEGEK